MGDFNRATLVGHLINEPDMKEHAGDDRLHCTFTLAVKRPYKDHDGKAVTDFFQIVCWGKLAQIAAEYCKKESDLLIDGRIQSRSYEAEGTTKWITEIIADSISFLGRGKKGDS